MACRRVAGRRWRRPRNPRAGVVNFAGGRGFKLRRTAFCKEDNLILLAAATLWWETARHVPELWIYSRNDHFFGPSLARQMFDAFTTAGGKATFIAAPAYGDDGHKYFDDVSTWKHGVDGFFGVRSISCAKVMSRAPLEKISF